MLSKIKTAALAACMLLASFLVTGCGGSSSGSPAPANVRVVNATSSDSLTVTINGTTQFSNVTASSGSAYSSVTAGTFTVTVAGSSGTLSSSTLTESFASSQTYTLLAYEREGSIRTALFIENQTAPISGYGTLNVANVSADAGPLDVYVVAPGTTNLTGLSPAFQYVSGTVASTMVAGTYDLIATAAGNRNDVRFTMTSVSVTTAQVETLALTSTAGGALVNGVLMIQGTVTNGVTFAPNTNARVRVVSALPAAGSSAVVATVGSTALAAVYTPTPGSYTLVAGGSSTYGITVSGTAVSGLPAATFAAGHDYTVLVYGNAASPLVAVFTDDNHQTIGGQVNLRLINAAVNVAGGLTLNDNNVAVANNIGYGAASGYFGTAASQTSTLEIIEPSVAPVIVQNQQLVSGSVYTVFVVDASLTPYVVKDR